MSQSPVIAVHLLRQLAIGLALHLDMQEEVILRPIPHGDTVEPVDLPFASAGVPQELAEFLVLRIAGTGGRDQLD